MGKKKSIIILIALVCIAFVLRWSFMPANFFFGPEQGRDFLVVRDMVVNHKLTLIGPRTDIEGVFHGPLFYYLETIPFAISHGDPVAVLAFFIGIQSLSVFIAYQLAYELTRKRRTGFIAATLFAVSFFCIVYARWLSHPSLSVPFSMLFILFLLRFIRGDSKYLIAAACMYGLLGQVEFINYLLFGAVGGVLSILYWKRFIKTNARIIVCAVLVGVVTSAATYILFDFRHNFMITSGILNVLQGKGGYKVNLGVSAAGAFRMLLDTASLIIGSYNWIVGLFVVVPIMAVWLRHVRSDFSFAILAVWVWIPPVVFTVLRHGMLLHFYAGIVAGFVILLALAIEWVWEKKKILGIAALGLAVVVNIGMTLRNLSTNNRVFFQIEQPAVRYTDQKAVIDWIYREAGGRPFEFQAFTIPYFLQEAWIYLFDQYGAARYGYQPTAVNRRLLYVIVQKSKIDPLYQKNWYDTTVSAWGRKIKETVIGEYLVEERIYEEL